MKTKEHWCNESGNQWYSCSCWLKRLVQATDGQCERYCLSLVLWLLQVHLNVKMHSVVYIAFQKQASCYKQNDTQVTTSRGCSVLETSPRCRNAGSTR